MKMTTLPENVKQFLAALWDDHEAVLDGRTYEVYYDQAHQWMVRVSPDEMAERHTIHGDIPWARIAAVRAAFRHAFPAESRWVQLADDSIREYEGEWVTTCPFDSCGEERISEHGEWPEMCPHFVREDRYSERALFAGEVEA